jgi:hypothetical protein
MADKTINDLTATTSLVDGDLFEIENTGNNSRKITAANVKQHMIGWALAGTGQTATGIYDFAADGAKANIDFTGLSGANELLIVARGLSNGTTGLRALRVSVDNGSTFYSTAGDYALILPTGVEQADTALAYNSTNSTAARSFMAHIVNTKGPVKACHISNSTADTSLFVASSSDINAIRIYNTGGGNMTAGTVRVFAR